MNREKLTLAVMAGCVGAALAASTPSFALDKATHHFAIPRESLADGLRTFGLTSGRDVVFDPDLVRGKWAEEVRGNFSDDDALSRLLVDSKLTYGRSPTGYFIIASPTEERAATSPSAPVVVASANAEEAQLVVVTGYRHSLLNATEAKQQSVNFGETVFSEDIGKFPDQNLAESLQRIPGVQLMRDSLTGEGTQVAVRALSPSFTSVFIDGNRVQVASFGQIENPTTGREVDLDLFPSELFSRIDVSKTPSAEDLDGGIAGSVNLTNARPFDRPGQLLTASISDGYQTVERKWSPKGVILASKTWHSFGVLFGLVAQSTNLRTDGWESIGWSNANLNCANCDNTTGNNFAFASTVPANVGNGLTPGGTLDLQALLALNPKLSANQLTNALIPRLARPMLMFNHRGRSTGVLSFEWRPDEMFRLSLDAIYGTSNRHLDRYDMNWQVRNSSQSFIGGLVPINLMVDANNVVTSGTFANANFMLENRTFDENLIFQSISPHFVWRLTDAWQVYGQLSANTSKDRLTRPSFFFATPANSGLWVTYGNSGGDFPELTTNAQLESPTLGGLGWRLQSVQLSELVRATTTRSAQFKTIYDLGFVRLKAGFAFDKQHRSITAFDNSAAYQAAFAADIPDSRLATYLVPNNAGNYLAGFRATVPYNNFVIANMAALKAATDYSTYVTDAPLANPGTAALTPGIVDETLRAVYVQAEGAWTVFGKELKANSGVRFVSTGQTTSGPVTINGNVGVLTLNHRYDDALPAVNVSYKVHRNLLLRIAASKTMSRPDPNAILPGISIIDPSAQTANAGNPNLKPFYSDNFDAGGEYYTGGLGYIGVTAFQKRMKNFTYMSQVQEPFAQLGIPVSLLMKVQQEAIAGNGGPNNSPVYVNTPVNSPDILTFKGLEATWVQPLDIILKGLGFSSVVTKIRTAGVARLATGVPRTSYNFTGYYEDRRFSFHVSLAHADRRSYLGAPQNGLPLGIDFAARDQVDLSAAYMLNLKGRRSKITFDVVNLNGAKIKQLFGFSNMTYSIYNPGTQYIVGWQQRF